MSFIRMARVRRLVPCIVSFLLCVRLSVPFFVHPCRGDESSGVSEARKSLEVHSYRKALERYLEAFAENPDSTRRSRLVEAVACAVLSRGRIAFPPALPPCFRKAFSLAAAAAGGGGADVRQGILSLLSSSRLHEGGASPDIRPYGRAVVELVWMAIRDAGLDKDEEILRAVVAAAVRCREWARSLELCVSRGLCDRSVVRKALSMSAGPDRWALTADLYGAAAGGGEGNERSGRCDPPWEAFAAGRWGEGRGTESLELAYSLHPRLVETLSWETPGCSTFLPLLLLRGSAGRRWSGADRACAFAWYYFCEGAPRMAAAVFPFADPPSRLPAPRWLELGIDVMREAGTGHAADDAGVRCCAGGRGVEDDLPWPSLLLAALRNRSLKAFSKCDDALMDWLQRASRSPLRWHERIGAKVVEAVCDFLGAEGMVDTAVAFCISLMQRGIFASTAFRLYMRILSEKAGLLSMPLLEEWLDLSSFSPALGPSSGRGWSLVLQEASMAVGLGGNAAGDSCRDVTVPPAVWLDFVLELCGDEAGCGRCMGACAEAAYCRRLVEEYGRSVKRLGPSQWWRAVLEGRPLAVAAVVAGEPSLDRHLLHACYECVRGEPSLYLPLAVAALRAGRWGEALRYVVRMHGSGLLGDGFRSWRILAAVAVAARDAEWTERCLRRIRVIRRELVARNALLGAAGKRRLVEAMRIEARLLEASGRRSEVPSMVEECADAPYLDETFYSTAAALLEKDGRGKSRFLSLLRKRLFLYPSDFRAAAISSVLLAEFTPVMAWLDISLSRARTVSLLDGRRCRAER